jgi:hypothetical protein
MVGQELITSGQQKIRKATHNIIYKILGLFKCLHKSFCPAPTFATADSDVSRQPQHFIYVELQTFFGQRIKQHLIN